MMTLAPIVIFAYRRPRHFAAVIDALRANPGADELTVIIYCDGPKIEAHEADVRLVREAARNVCGFRKVEVIERNRNFGLSRSVTEGVRDVCDEFGCAIVLEDDIKPTPYFLPYMNRALGKYANDERVISVGCYSFAGEHALPDTFFLSVPDCWGWGVWARGWKQYRPDGAWLLQELRQRGLIDAFDFEGGYPYSKMLADQVAGINNSWAVRWYAAAMLSGGLTLYPRLSVTENIGFDLMGTHTKSGSGLPKNITADRPMKVETIAVEQSVAARRAWAEAFRSMRPNWRRRALGWILRRKSNGSLGNLNVPRCSSEIR